MVYRVIDHTADSGIEVDGSTAAELFAAAGSGMFHLMYGELASDRGREVSLSSTGDGYAELLVNWLSDLLAESEIGEIAFVSVSIDKIGEDEVRATGMAVPLADVPLVGPPIKAVTYHDVVVERVGERWRARVIFDV